MNAQSVLLALLTFLLGLVSSVLVELFKRVFLAERRRIQYRVTHVQLIGVQASLSESEVLPQLIENAQSVALFTISVENVSSHTVEDAGFVVEPVPGASIITKPEIKGSPVGLVDYSVSDIPSLPYTNSLVIKGIRLESKQRLDVRLLIKADRDPDIRFTHGSGADTVWEQAKDSEAADLETHINGVIFYNILAQIPFGLFAGLGALAVLLPGPVEDAFRIQSGGVGIGEVLASLVSLYFYLRLLPHAQALVKEWFRRRTAL